MTNSFIELNTEQLLSLVGRWVHYVFVLSVSLCVRVCVCVVIAELDALPTSMLVNVLSATKLEISNLPLGPGLQMMNTSLLH